MRRQESESREELQEAQDEAPQTSIVSPQIRERIMTMKIYDGDRETRKAIRRQILAFAARLLEPQESQDLTPIMRRAVAIAGFPAACPRNSCRRANRCTTPFVVCRFERFGDFEPHNNRFAENDQKYGDPFYGEPG